MKCLLRRTVFVFALALGSMWSSSAQAAPCIFELGNNEEEFIELDSGYREFYSPYYYNPNDAASVATLSKVPVAAFVGPDGSGCFILFGDPKFNGPLHIEPFAGSFLVFAKYQAKDAGLLTPSCEAVIITGTTCDWDATVFFEASVVPFFERSAAEQQGLVETTTRFKSVLVRLKLYNNAADFWAGDGFFDPNLLSDPGNFIFGF